jgi:hypothetical protein
MKSSRLLSCIGLFINLLVVGARLLTMLNKRDRWILRASAVWSAYVWGVLTKNMIRDREHDTKFRLVHIGLALVSFTFAAATWKAAGRRV